MKVTALLKRGRAYSLKLRLLIWISVVLISCWIIAAIFAWHEAEDYIDEFYDTRQVLFAKRLASGDLSSLTGKLSSTKEMLGGHGKRGDEEDEALGFAVFTTSGIMIQNDGENGEDFIFMQGKRGFVNTKIKNSSDKWRIVWIPSTDGEFIVAVGQELDYRKDLVFDLLEAQLSPWLVMFPILILGVFIVVLFTLRPLKTLSSHLERRSVNDSGSLPTLGVPSEVKPLVEALNAFFARLEALITRERSFTSNAAHELRTPLAALRIQAEVAMMNNAENMDDYAKKTKLDKSLVKILQGIDRSSHLIDQLLLLSRLDSLDQLDSTDFAESASQISKTEMVNMNELLQSEIQKHCDLARNNNITVHFASTDNMVMQGNSNILGLLFRNLLNNALRYAPAGTDLLVHVGAQSIIFSNAIWIAEDFLDTSRLGERFFRPPGQKESGSGLGLSIVKRIATLHGLKVKFSAKELNESAEVDNKAYAGAKAGIFSVELRR